MQNLLETPANYVDRPTPEQDRAHGRNVALLAAKLWTDDRWQGFAEGLEEAGIRLLTQEEAEAPCA